MPVIRDRRGHLLLVLDNLAHPEFEGVITANTAVPSLPISSVTVPGFDSHWQTGDGHWPGSTDVRIRLDWPEPRLVDFVALAGIAFRGVDPLDLRWRVEVSENARDFTTAADGPLVVRAAWGGQRWGEPNLWFGGPSASELAVLSRRLRFHSGVRLASPHRVKALRLVIPAPASAEPSAYLRVAELWTAHAWQSEVNFQWGADFSGVDLGNVDLSPDGWDFGDPGRQLRAWGFEWDHVDDHDLFHRLAHWWMAGGAKRRAFVVPFPDKGHLWHELSMVARVREIRGSVDGFWDSVTDRNSLQLDIEEALG